MTLSTTTRAIVQTGPERPHPELRVGSTSGNRSPLSPGERTGMRAET